MIYYSLKQKAVGDTVLVSWDEIEGTIRYELQYFINDEWVTIYNNLTDLSIVYTFEDQNKQARFRVRGITEQWETKWVEGESFEVTVKSSLEGSMVIHPLNKMRGYADIIGYRERFLDGSILVRQNYKNDLGVVLDIPKKERDSNIDGCINIAVTDSKDLSGSITLNPSARMRGLAEIVQPPRRVKKIYPTKDSVVRQSAPTINYGDSQQMMAGASAEGKFISYLGFDLNLPTHIDIEYVKLVLNKQYSTTRRFLMGLYETSYDWNEYDISWNYRPLEENFTVQFPVNTETGKVEVDLTSTGWDEGTKSFILHPTNYSFSELTAFSTRESLDPPYIEVAYYEIIDSAGSYSLDSSLVVRAEASRDLSSTIDVMSDYNYGEIESSVILDKKYQANTIDGNILVAETRQKHLDSSIELSKKILETEIDSTIAVLYRDFLEAAIDIDKKELINELDSTISIRAWEESSVDLTLDIESKEVESELGSNIIVQRDSEEDLESSLEIKRNDVELDIDSSLVVSRIGLEEIPSSLLIEEKQEDSEIAAGILVGRREASYLDSELGIVSYDETKELDTELYVLFRSDLESKLEVPKIDAEIELETGLEINKKEISSLLDTSMIVRVFWVDELESFIDVERSFEIGASIELTHKEDSNDLDAGIYVDVGGDYVFIM